MAKFFLNFAKVATRHIAKFGLLVATQVEKSRLSFTNTKCKRIQFIYFASIQTE